MVALHQSLPYPSRQCHFFTIDVLMQPDGPFLAEERDLLYRFEDFVLDTDRRELRRGPQLVAIPPQVFDILEYLIKNRNRVVSKDDLIAAIWAGRIISESALTTRINVLRSAIDDTGEDQRLIRTLPRKGVRFVGIVRDSHEPGTSVAAAGMVHPRPALSLPDRPSIAVLPFTNLSSDPEQDYFADGMVEEIITALSRLRWLFVIARNSSFAYKGRPVDVRQVGRELGVRYVLEGSVRKSANQVRITGQLIDASTGAHIWADRFDGAMEDVFKLQDQVTVSVVGAIAPKMEQAEIERARRKPTENLDAYDYYLQGKASVHQATKQAHEDALRLFYKSVELDRDFASAYGMAAWCYAWRMMNGWMEDRAKEVAETARLALRAVELGKDDAVALTMGGFALALVVGDVEDGAAFIDRALVLNPNLAAGWLLSGLVNGWLGRPEAEIERATRAVRLSPLDPLTSLAFTIIGAGHFLVGRYDEASSWVEKTLREQANWAGAARVAAASHALAGRLDQAQKAAARLRQIDPTFRISDFRRMHPFRRPEDLARFEEGLRKAGLPE
jgi:TolB-like protein/tetratricopeptide (TPR) repeat protein